jgi:hypothetical protein
MITYSFLGCVLCSVAKRGATISNGGDVFGLMAVALGVAMLVLVLVAAIVAMACKILAVRALMEPARRPRFRRFLAVAFLEFLIMSFCLVAALASVESHMPGWTQSPGLLLASVLGLAAALHWALAFLPNLWLAASRGAQGEHSGSLFGSVVNAGLLGLFTPGLVSLMIALAFDLVSGGKMLGPH